MMRFIELLILLLWHHSLTILVNMLNSSGSLSIIIVNYPLIYSEFRYRTVFSEVVFSLLQFIILIIMRHKFRDFSLFPFLYLMDKPQILFPYSCSELSYLNPTSENGSYLCRFQSFVYFRDYHSNLWFVVFLLYNYRLVQNTWFFFVMPPNLFFLEITTSVSAQSCCAYAQKEHHREICDFIHINAFQDTQASYLIVGVHAALRL